MSVKQPLMSGVLLSAALSASPVYACIQSTIVGSWINGEPIVSTADGDKYAADSGTQLQLGCTWFLDNRSTYSGSLSLGYRHQFGAKEEEGSSGAVLESSIAVNLDGLAIGGGAVHQFSSVVSDSRWAGC